MTETRYGVVTGARSADEVRAYLPDNYQVADVTQVGAGRLEVLICGVDRAGWTFDGYVVPRLASGLMACREVPPAHVSI